jgi:putative hemolysin
MATDILLLLLLILLNGVFAMSEIAIVSSRKARLQQLLGEGSSGAGRAIELAEDPSRFLSTIQVGITSIGILAGAFGEATVADKLQLYFERLPALAPYASALALGIVVVCLTYVSLIVGELVPKRVALLRPERIASFLAPAMHGLSVAARPVVRLLSLSTEFFLALLGARKVKEPSVTEEEIKVMFEQGTEEGVFVRAEQELVENVLRLDQRNVGSIMTPRLDVIYLDSKATFERNREKLLAEPHSMLPVCDGGLEHVIGFVRSTDILERLLRSERVDLVEQAKPPLYVPESITLMQLLEHFKRAHLPTALVVDEYGEVAGLVTVTDVVGAIVGDFAPEQGEEPLVVQREDGSWLVDGMLDLDSLKALLGADKLPDEELGNYHTAGGLAMLQISRVPRKGDKFELMGFRIEVLDMDKNRVDQLLVSRLPPIEASPQEPVDSP